MHEYQKIKDIVSTTDGKYLSSRMTEAFFIKNFGELVDYIKSETKFYSDEEANFTKRIMLVLANKKSRLVCNCGKEISPMKRGEVSGEFREFCSIKCVGLANKGMKIVRTEQRIVEINEKRVDTMLKKHGYAYNSQRPEVKKILVDANRTTHSHIRYDLLDDKMYITNLYKTLSSTEIAKICNCDYSVVLDYLRSYGVVISGKLL